MSEDIKKIKTVSLTNVKTLSNIFYACIEGWIKEWYQMNINLKKTKYDMPDILSNNLVVFPDRFNIKEVNFFYNHLHLGDIDTDNMIIELNFPSKEDIHEKESLCLKDMYHIRRVYNEMFDKYHKAISRNATEGLVGDIIPKQFVQAQIMKIDKKSGIWLRFDTLLHIARFCDVFLNLMAIAACYIQENENIKDFDYCSITKMYENEENCFIKRKTND